MSRLREKINALVPIEFGGMQEPLLTELEQIADDEMIKFFDWANVNAYKYPTQTTTSELLQIFKENHYE